VLVLDGNENQAVACARSLARAGHRVVVGADAAWSKAGWSRSAAARFRYPSPRHQADAFVRRIAAEAAREPGTLVLPMTERSTLPISAGREQLLAAGARLVLPDHATVLEAFDKDAMSRLAARLGLNVPQSAVVADPAGALQAAARIGYPVVIKPRSSEEAWLEGVRSTGPPRYARDEAELARAWSDLARRCRSAIVQEYVRGAGAGYFVLVRRGVLRAEFAHRRVRDVRPTGSGSAVRISAAPDPRVRAQALALLAALEWHGIAMVEFRLRPDGTPVFLELNGRFWNSLPLAVHAGTDFPALLAALAEHGDVTPPPAYRTGVRCRWLLGDVRHAVEVWRGAPAGYPEPYPGRLRTLIAVLTPVPGTVHDNFCWRDPLPELGDWLDFLLHRLPRWTASGAAGRVEASGRGRVPDQQGQPAGRTEGAPP
jgi:predicted ATP-grasp superfamily ATP-dependent carboligase